MENWPYFERCVNNNLYFILHVVDNFDVGYGFIYLYILIWTIWGKNHSCSNFYILYRLNRTRVAVEPGIFPSFYFKNAFNSLKSWNISLIYKLPLNKKYFISPDIIKKLPYSFEIEQVLYFKCQNKKKIQISLNLDSFWPNSDIQILKYIKSIFLQQKKRIALFPNFLLNFVCFKEHIWMT